MRRRLVFAAATLMAAIEVAELSPLSIEAARAQTLLDESACRGRAMPPLPPEADLAPTTPRRGYQWTLGHHRCANGRWEYVPGSWRRAGRPIPIRAAIGFDGSGLRARWNYRLVNNGRGLFAYGPVDGVRTNNETRLNRPIGYVECFCSVGNGLLGNCGWMQGSRPGSYVCSTEHREHPCRLACNTRWFQGADPRLIQFGGIADQPASCPTPVSVTRSAEPTPGATP